MRLPTPQIIECQKVCLLQYSRTFPDRTTPERSSKVKLKVFSAAIFMFNSENVRVVSVCTFLLMLNIVPSILKPRVGKKTDTGSKCSTPFVERLGDIQERINTTKRVIFGIRAFLLLCTDFELESRTFFLLFFVRLRIILN